MMVMLADIGLTPQEVAGWTWRELLIYWQESLIQKYEFESVLFASIINAGGPKKPVKPSELNPLENVSRRNVRKITRIEDLISAVELFTAERRAGR